MNRLRVFKEPGRPPARFCRQLAGLFEMEFKDAAKIGSGRPGPYTMIDMDLSDASRIGALKEWLSRKPEGAKVIFCTDKGSHLQDTRAYAVGATDVLHRPVDGRALLAQAVGRGVGDVAWSEQPGDRKVARRSPPRSIRCKAFSRRHALART